MTFRIPPAGSGGTSEYPKIGNNPSPLPEALQGGPGNPPPVVNAAPAEAGAPPKVNDVSTFKAANAKSVDFEKPDLIFDTANKTQAVDKISDAALSLPDFDSAILELTASLSAEGIQNYLQGNFQEAANTFLDAYHLYTDELNRADE